MKLRILGSGREVGRSAIAVDSTVMDYGINIQTEPPSYPVSTKGISSAVLTHAHLDHCGALPLLMRRGKVPVYMTDVTLDLASLLLRDSMKVARKEGFDVPFQKKHVRYFQKNAETVGYGKEFDIGDKTFRLYNAGHIPGSAGVYVENRSSLFYTGDMQTLPSHLVKPYQLPPSANTVVLDSTYSYKDHPDRKEEEQRFIESVEEAVSRGETALIPVFAVGRAQEVLLILEKYADVIAMDGMAKIASDIIMQYSSHVRNPKHLEKVLNKVSFIQDHKERKEAVGKFPVILSTAGMMGGGPVISYLKGISKRNESKVLFSGFLVEDTPGRRLLETRIFQTAEEKFHVHCDLKQFRLSGHMDRTGIGEILDNLNPEKVVCVHGDRCPEFAKELRQEGYEAYAPKNGESIKV